MEADGKTAERQRQRHVIILRCVVWIKRKLLLLLLETETKSGSMLKRSSIMTI